MRVNSPLGRKRTEIHQMECQFCLNMMPMAGILSVQMEFSSFASRAKSIKKVWNDEGTIGLF